jgi:uncharacterized protein (TIGR03000 family)
MMKRHLVYGLPILSLGLLLVLSGYSDARSTKSAGSGSSRSSTRNVIYVPATAEQTARAAPDEDYAYGSADEAFALVRLRVPANAQVWFDGTATTQTGSLRPFIASSLEPGKDYSYEIRVRWTESGKPVEQTRKITFRSGDRLTLNLMR